MSPPPSESRGRSGPRKRRAGVVAPATGSGQRPPHSVGVDTGGTFTDFVARAGNRIVTFKLPSTPDAPDRAVLAGLERLGAGRTTRVRHGSTVATNALLERKGARVAFVTTAGFEDVLEIGRQERPELYAIAPRRPAPLVPAERRIGVAERIGPRGERWRTLTRAALARMRRAVRRARPEAIAIGLLHAYADPAHERAVARALGDLGVPITRASELCPEIREYERFATTAANAYLMPRVATYLESLARHAGPRLEVVLSHGGTAPAARAAREPARQLLSGPAAGVRAARDAARACGFHSALTLDVGGTSTDCAYIERDLPRRRAREIAGIPIQLPMLDVHTLGAGGGSIARVDAGGLLHVGPESAGSVPGPACYGRGGPPTVTDALVVLGKIPGDALAGGTFPIDRGAATRALRGLARALGHDDPARAAAGVVAVTESRIAAALRLVSVERGHDPRDAALVCFGGAGGLHACALAEVLGCTVLFPRHAGVLSAVGALAGGSRREKSRSVLLDTADRRGITRVLAELEAAARRELERGERGAALVERWAEARYRGQAHEISIPAGGEIARRFHAEHRRRYGFSDPEAAVEIVTLEVRVALPGEPLPRRHSDGGSLGREPGRATVVVRHEGRPLEARLWRMESLPARFRARGPGLVVEHGATLWIAPGWNVRRHASGALLLERGRGSAGVRRVRAVRRRPDIGRGRQVRE